MKLKDTCSLLHPVISSLCWRHNQIQLNKTIEWICTCMYILHTLAMKTGQQSNLPKVGLPKVHVGCPGGIVTSPQARCTAGSKATFMGTVISPARENPKEQEVVSCPQHSDIVLGRGRPTFACIWQLFATHS